jgi:trans-aconitate 2-methyltransferase
LRVSTPRDWDAATYDRVADPQARWGRVVLGRLPLNGDEAVLDAGCGSGRVTELLAERLPRGRVVALDASPSMVDEARRRLARFEDRVEYVVADLARPFAVPGGTVDAILSTATFHWIPDHDALFRNLAAVVRPGGRLVAQCGGAGNIAAIRAAIEEVSGDPWMPWNFATPEETEERLHAAGFREARAWLYERPVTPDEPLAFLKTAILGEHLERLPEGERDAFAQAVLDRLDTPFVARYVRLNMEANAGA